ncbi:hypothetical protein BH10ACT10_BH10ACT10_10440 [soil metagenome]
MRRRVPWWVLVVLFVVLPVVEIYVLIQVGQVIGAWWTVLLLLADGFLGGWLMKREGVRAWRSLREALEIRRIPSRELADAALILVGGTLLLTPGFVSDIAGVFLILPFTRPVARTALTRFLTRKFLTGPQAAGPQAAGPQAAGTRQRPGPDGVVRGEVID